MVSPSLSCSIVFLVLLQGQHIYLPFRFLLILLCGLQGRQSLQFDKFSFFFRFSFSFLLFTITRFGRLAEMRWFVCISKPRRIFCVSFSRTDSVGWAFSLKVSLSKLGPSFLISDFACLSLEIPIQLHFFPFLFSRYCCPVDPCVVCVVSNHCSFLWSFQVDVSLFSILASPLPPSFLTPIACLCHL